MTRPRVNRVVLLLVGVALAGAGAVVLMTGGDLVPAAWQLRSPPSLWASLTDATTGASAFLAAGSILVGLVVVALGGLVVKSQVSAGRRTRRRRSDLDLDHGTDATTLSGSALSEVVASDLTRLHEVLSASVTTWQDAGDTNLHAVLILGRGHQITDVRRGIGAVLQRAEQALDGAPIHSSVRIDLSNQPPPRVR